MVKKTKKLIWYGLSLLGISCYAVWTDDDCISGYQTPKNSVGQLVVPQDHILQDVAANSGKTIPQSLGIYTVLSLS